MSNVVLQKADLALFSDLTQRVTIPHLTGSQPSRVYEGTTVRFAGDRYGTPFRGEGVEETWALTARYGASEQTQLRALLDLIETANGSADSRLFLRTHYGQVAGLDAAQAVVIYDVQPVPQAGLYIDLSFTARAVNFTLEV